MNHFSNVFTMRGSVVQIALLFFLSSVKAQTSDPSIAAVWKELKMLRDIVVEQRVELRSLETRVRDAEVHAEEERNKVLLLTIELKNMLSEVEDQSAELVVAKNKITELEKENTGRNILLQCICRRKCLCWTC